MVGGYRVKTAKKIEIVPYQERWPEEIKAISENKKCGR
jgi:hypothetical protein